MLIVREDYLSQFLAGGGRDDKTVVPGVFSQYPGNLFPLDMLHCILKGASL